ncbi:hypothetical protein [Desulfogranum japonicum]|uniref:hypothetical protein n=1 Tax=Desulfogranum japonicum TaxID=231447 RepID=UPI000425125C|nr:hypothetical protein [Desulfogranum japonicum]
MLCSIAPDVAQDSLKAINDLEKDLGRPILAYSCNALSAAELSEEQVAKIKEAEEKLGLTLVAVNG